MRVTLLLLVAVTRLGMTQQVPVASVAAGAGQAFGMFGMRGEVFAARGALSVLVAAGYNPDVYDRSHLTGAATLRYYVRGSQHRVYVDASWTPLYTWVTTEEHVAYGPGLSVGYAFVAMSGFTASLAGGVAYDRRGFAPGGWSDVWPLVQLGVGWTFRRHVAS